MIDNVNICYDYERFVEDAQRLVQLSTQHGRGEHLWQWREPTAERDGFLIKRHKTAVRAPREETAREETAADPREETAAERDASIQVGDQATDPSECQRDDCAAAYEHLYEHHVVYSRTYGMPVLYFIGYDAEGAPRGAEAVLSDLQPSLLSSSSRWSAITQDDHPVLGIPFFFIHPCNSRKLLLEFLSSSHPHPSSIPFLLSWLSFYGPLAGIKFPLAFIQLCSILN